MGSPVSTNVKLQRIRVEISEAKSALQNLDLCLLPKEQAEAAAARFIAGHAQHGHIAASYFAAGEELPLHPNKLDPFAMLCWLVPDAVQQRFNEEIAKAYVDREWMDPTQRARQRKELEKKIFELEVAEERLIVQSEQAGIPLTRREDADPRAVLEA